jgi:hypothetical protein
VTSHTVLSIKRFWRNIHPIFGTSIVSSYFPLCDFSYYWNYISLKRSNSESHKDIQRNAMRVLTGLPINYCFQAWEEH